MVEAKSIFHSKSMKVQGLQLVDELYIRARTGKMSYLGSSVLVVATISVKTPGKGFFRQLLSKLKEAAETNNYILKVENVISTELREFLIREGFHFLVNGGCAVPATGLHHHLGLMTN
jgi:hypothetical protein